MTQSTHPPIGVSFLKIAQVWSLLNPEQRKWVLAARKEVHLKRNDVVYHQGDVPKYLYYVKRGIIKVQREDRPQRSQTLRFITKGGVFGYRAGLARQRYLSSALAFEDATVVGIPFDFVMQLLQEIPSLTLMLVEDLAIELGRSDCRIVGLTQKHLRGRMADTLLFLVENFGLDPLDNTLRVQLMRQDIANLANMTTANAIRTLATFVSEGVLVVSGRNIRVLDIATLREISNKS